MNTALNTQSLGAPAKDLVVVIDDDPDILDAFSQLLTLEGFSVHSYTSARDYLQALDRPGTAVPSCILCDVVMPDMDGLQLQAHLNQQRHIGLVLMSGSCGVQEAVQAFRSGVVDFLLKPIGSDLLISTIRRAFSATQQQHQASERSREVSRRLACLSQRELEVMRLVACGMTNLGISLQLGITERTVKFHRQRLGEKLAVSGTAELTRLYQAFEQHSQHLTGSAHGV